MSTPYESYALGDGEHSELNSLQHKNVSRPTDASKGIKREMLGATDDFNSFYETVAANNNPITQVEKLDQQKLTKSPLLNQGWNYYSFSTKVGGAAFREELLSLESWKERYDEYLKSPTEKLILENKISQLSPIEKYEYLIGTTEYTLTQEEWKKGVDLYNRFQKVPSWAGACHGTAPAILNSKEPNKDITVTSADGKRVVHFSLRDLKVLISYIWAHNPAPFAMLGQRCNYPMSTETYDQVSSCFDTNPGSFHLAMTNLVGKDNQAIILDTSPGKEVWNRPVLQYEYQYINPITKRPTQKLSSAQVDIKKFTNDPYKHKRSKKAVTVVGIWMKVKLLSDIPLEEESPKEPLLRDIEFVYDLEIDRLGHIVGGEWQTKQFPDFAWINKAGTQPLTIYDRIWRRSYSNSHVQSQIPQALNQVALQSHARGAMSYYFLEYLTLLAQ